MSRFLFVVPPLVEQARPTFLVAQELTARGHDVSWADGHDLLRPDVGLRSPTGLMVLWDDFLLPLARDMLPTTRAAVARFRPDALVVDQQAFAGAAVAHLSGLPWATIVPTSAGLADPLRDLPAIARWVRQRTSGFLRDAGLDDATAERIDLQASPYLVIAFTTEELTGPIDDRTGRYAFVGPCLPAPGEDAPFNWARLDRGRPLVLVGLETPPWRRGAQLYPKAAEALAPLDVQAVIAAPPDLLPDPPPNTIVVPKAPLRALARQAAAVVCDGGHDIVCEALLNGVPLVVTPAFADQPLIAEQVVRAGAAIRVPRDVLAPQLRRAVATVLTEQATQDHALRVRDSFTDAGGVVAAADEVEALVRGVPIRPSPTARRHTR